MDKITILIATAINAKNQGIYSSLIHINAWQAKTEVIKLPEHGEDFYKDQIGCYGFLEYFALSQILNRIEKPSQIRYFSESIIVTSIELKRLQAEGLKPQKTSPDEFRHPEIYRQLRHALQKHQFSAHYLHQKHENYAKALQTLRQMNRQVQN